MGRKGKIALTAMLLMSSACAAGTTAHQTELGGFPLPGTADTSNLSRDEMHGAIEQARLHGELTAEQARTAHMQLDVKGHLTQEQIQVINRDRLAKRDDYETKKEGLDVLRDTFQTGTSVTGNLNDTLDNIRAIFK